jgi:branched-chain amino acid transport system ATP-binding protein
MSEPILVADDLIAGYLPGVDILRGCSVEVSEGELVGIIGPNGAGKSTLVKAVFGLVKIRSGSVRLGTEDITSLPAHKLVAAGVGYVPQRENVFGALTVEENLRMGLFLRPDAWDERWEFVTEMFPRLGERATQRAGLLSGGERQMLAMGRALMMDPSVLLLDEPSAGLSPANQDLIFEQVRAICDTGVSVLMVEQNARRCLQICDRAYVLDQGKDAHTGTGHDLLHDPKVVELYLGMLGKVD